MNRAKAYRLALADARRRYPGESDADLDEAVNEILRDWQAEAAHDREVFGEPEDTYCLESGVDNCDDWGTGEGQFHGRI